MSVMYVFLTQMGNYTVPEYHQPMMEKATVASIGCSFAGTMLIHFTWVYLGLGSDNFFISGNLATIVTTAQAGLMGLENTYPDKGFCIAATVAIVFLFTSAYSWMFLFACWKLADCTIGIHGSKHFRRIMYVIVGYGIPWAGIIPILLYYPDNLINGKICWLTEWTQWIFMGPVYCILGFNQLVLLLSLWNRWKKDCEKEERKSLKHKLTNLVVTFFGEMHLFGTTWLFGLIPLTGYSTLPFGWAFILLAGPQNFYMFFLYYCTHKDVLALLASHYEDTVEATLEEIKKKKAQRGGRSSDTEEGSD
ncbi:adhesion G-protein coupled receptor D2-like [Octopus sinensis]|nr:adhesion G-protein coupled receptor D2-like [Octopus sinensis]